MARRILTVAAIALLAGCGSQPAPPDGSSVVTTLNPDGSTTVSPVKPPTTVNVSECDRAETAPVYADARITTCVADRRGRERGTVIYESAAAPATVVAWSKEQALKHGLKVNFETATTVSASEGSRTLLVVAMANGSGSRVTVNWGR